jgi:hypothetical protein
LRIDCALPRPAASRSCSKDCRLIVIRGYHAVRREPCKPVAQLDDFTDDNQRRRREASLECQYRQCLERAVDDTLQIIDKDKLEVVASVTPAPGKTAAHVEFTRDGRYALVSVWEMDGALVVYDAQTLKEVKRLPMKRPVGKYNVYNKITRSEGTSH